MKTKFSCLKAQKNLKKSIFQDFFFWNHGSFEAKFSQYSHINHDDKLLLKDANQQYILI